MNYFFNLTTIYSIVFLVISTTSRSILLCLFLLNTALFSSAVFTKNLAIDPTNIYPKVKLETTMGIIIIELDRVRAPISVDNFLTYVVTGEYNNTIFHRIVEDFIVQGGGYDDWYHCNGKRKSTTFSQ